MAFSFHHQPENRESISINAHVSGGVLRPKMLLLFACLAGVLAVTGCHTKYQVSPSDFTLPGSPDSAISTSPKGDSSVVTMPVGHTESIVLREGDVLKITFPGSPNLDSTQPIRRDGKINLNLVGEVKAVGKTPAELKEDLIKLYASQLDSKEVMVELLSSSFPVFVTGAVMHAEKVLSDHPITALEAIMEAGGPDYTKANLKTVRVLRQESGNLKSYQLNLKTVLDGTSSEQFYLKPSDIIYVPEKFNWF